MSFGALLEFVLPPACAGCGGLGSLLCRHCAAALGSAFDPAAAFLTADPSVLSGSEVELTVAAFRHDGVARRTLQRLKYGGAARLAEPLVRAALPAFDRLLAISGPATLVPVPVHPGRARERGYNQAALLARALGTSRDLPVADVLRRPRATTRQHGLDRSARLANLRAAFALAVPRVPPRVVVVDDILTTGATMEACASVLRGGGARLVYGFAMAREV